MGKHRKFGKTAVIVTAVTAAVALLGVWGISSVAGRLNQAARSSVQTVQAQSGTIESTVAGVGTLEYEDAQNISVPAGLEIVSVLQGQGRHVAKGDLLATVSQSSCEVRMSELYTQIAQTDEQMRAEPQETEPVEVKAPQSGQISVINAAKGASVLDVLAGTGALAVLATDDRVGVTIDSADAAAALPGETVLVEFDGGTRIAATVQDVDDTGFTAVLTDRSAAQQANVTAFTPQGEQLGTGVTKPLGTVDIVGPAGTVESVRVSAGTDVKAGDVLFTVRPSGKSASYLALEQQRAALAKEYDQLAVIADKGGIIAPVSGTIVTCAVSAGQNTSALAGAADLSAVTGGSGAAELPFSAQDALGILGGGMGPKQRQEADRAEPDDSDEVSSETPEPEEPSQEPVLPAPQYTPDAPAPSEAPAQTPVPDRSIPRIEVPLVPPIAGLPLQTKLAVLPVYSGTVEWEPADVVAMHSTDYTARVSLVAAEGFQFAPDCTATVLQGEVQDVQADGRELTFAAVYPTTCGELTLPDIDWSAIQDFLNAGGSLDLSGLQSLLASGAISSSALGFDLSALSSQIDPSSLYGQIDASALTEAMDGVAVPSDISSMIPNTASVLDSLSQSMDTADPTAYTIAPDDGMQMTMQVNQMDILSVHPGMSCTVTVDAIPNTEFEGTVSSVSQTVSSSGDYTAQIVIPMEDRMRAGMTAAATIVTQETEGVLTLPVAALQEDGKRVFVYTEYDAGADELSGEVDVETGVSNGSEVEILGGLEPEQTVYYEGDDGISGMMRMLGAQRPEEEGPGSTYVPPAEAISTP